MPAALPLGNPIRCHTCRTVRYTLRNDPTTWACPTCDTDPAPVQTFTVDPYAVRTQFAPATRPAYPKETK